jgi:membrane-bound lytic murein transglycosylase A
MRSRFFSGILSLTACAALLMACASPDKGIEIPGESPAAAKPAATTTAATTSAPQSSSSGSTAGQADSFVTQLANYTVIGFDTLPGWSTDNFVESWPAFLESCKVLSGRETQWRELCARARSVDGTNLAAVRGFYEREFVPYQIRDDERQVDGVVTGYFEPLLEGSKRYGAPFIYPVYGQPEDMYYLDVRRVPAAQRKSTMAARLEGRNVVIQNNLSTRDMAAPGVFALDLAPLSFDMLDRKLRLRINGKQLLPYFTRGEIETLGAPNARVIAFVDNVMALYEMQVQGAGRIRMREGGEVIRVSYAEQNGHPFRPNIVASKSAKSSVKVRGRSVELTAEDDDDSDGDAIRTRGFKLAKPANSGAVAVPRAPGAPAAAAARPTGSGITDPSYVFFKENSAASGGPVGALGVPLSAGRSIAVDPRSTPLGYPVFVSTRNPTNGTPMRRLTIAQDTGGAIRGAVRADYFFGEGAQAANQARRMKERGQLWLLLPKGIRVAASSSSGIRTRGSSSEAVPECLMPVDDACVEDK